MEDFFQKFRGKFIDEVVGLLEQFESDILKLETDSNNRTLIDAVFRAMHTIKGTSSMYGFKHINDYTHHLENIFQEIRDSNTPFERNIIEISLSSLDHIRQLLNDENLTNPVNQHKHAELMANIQNYSTSEVNTELKVFKELEELDKANVRTWYILLKADEQIFFRGVSLVNILSDLASLGTYKTHRIQSLSNETSETWGIVLISQSHINDIKEVFMFIEDNCSFILLKEGDILQQDENAADQISGLTNLSIDEVIARTNTEFDQTIVKTEAVNHIETDARKKVANNITAQNFLSIKRINVDSSKLDYLMFLVSELITLNTQLLQTTKDDYYENIRPQIEKLENLSKLFRNNALEIRLVPLGDIIIKFQRLVRDLSKKTSKNIEFITVGTDTELDKNTIDLIADPMIHILRNCVDHGIETPEERKLKGKSEMGTIKLSAHHVGNFIHIKIEDDGAGLDLEKIQKKAINKGLIKVTDVLTKQELINLIFHSGLSTANAVTDVSGRGVGMDVVKKKITELRGEIFIDTEKDKGSTFTLKIQQSIAIIDSLLFRVERSFFILPLTEIEVCMHILKSDLILKQNTSTIHFNNNMIPFLDLRAMFHLGGSYPDTVKTLILKEGNDYLALLCDEIFGEQQAVLKPLGQAFEKDSVIMNVSQHGDGQWAYMLNTHILFQNMRKGISNKSKLIV